MRRRVVVGAVLGGLFVLGWWAGGGRAAHGPYSGLDLFLEVLQTVESNHVDPVDTHRLVTGAMRGVAQGLDPWSRYLDPEEFRAARATIQGTFDGVGASVDQRSGWPVVIAPVEGSPAWDAGLEPGDVITEVDGRSTFGLSPDEMSGRLRGAPGTLVRLTVARGDDERSLELRRRRVTVRNVPYALLAEPGVAYVRLAQFSARAGAEVAAACDSLRGLGARALVLDVRGNPGGTLEEAVAVASQFLPVGSRVVSTEGRTPASRQRFTATRPRPELAWPVAVLVDGGTASAAEIVAGALQDHDRAVLVGDTTYGKGVSQQIYPLRTGLGALQLTVSRYLTPSGRSIHREPLAAEVPDEDESPVTGERVPPSRDTLRSRAFRTALGREVRGGDGLAPDVHVEAEPHAAAPRRIPRGSGGMAAAAREALAGDPVYRRAIEVVRRASDARGVFAAAGVQLPGGPPARGATGREALR
jgi:carboxyl-terminal processing protease